MINKIKNININEYFISVAVAVILAVTVSLFVELELLFRTEENVNNSGFAVENLAEFYSIEKLEKKFADDPENYLISIKLAQKYEELNHYSRANEYYETALKLSDRSNYSLYTYAMFCARQNLFTLAATLGEELSETGKKSIQYKTNIYEQIAQGLDASGQYEASVKAYQIAYKYAKNLKDIKHMLKIKKLYALEYIKLADKRMEKGDTIDAAADLKNSIKILYSPIAEYKLGLIYQNIDKVKAEKYVHNAFSKNPYIINPYIYNSLLVDLITQAEKKRDKNSINYYSIRLDRYKKTLEKVYVYKDDFLVDGAKLFQESKPFSKEKKYYLTFDLTNNSKIKVDNLIMEVDMYVNSKKYTASKKIITPTNPIQSSDTVEDLKIEFTDNIQTIDLGKNDIIIKYYVRKKTKAPWTLIKIDSMNF